ncbi:MAG: hypothetical protein FJ405_11375 [Verrucomicrobia bacterium]|nr:hypothetical protein [Verrucomicrobiota bacterium]
MRWLEKMGCDVTYCTSVDTHSLGATPGGKQVKAFLSVGHDEYWSEPMRNQIESARDSGIHLAVLSANTCYWRIQFDSSLRSFSCDKGGSPPRNLWRRGVGRPEVDLLGTQYVYNSLDADLKMPDPLPDHFSYAHTGIEAGELLPGLLGYEVDGEWDNYPTGIDRNRPVSPEGTIRLSSTRFSSTAGARGTAYSTFMNMLRDPRFLPSVQCNGFGDWTTSITDTRPLGCPEFLPRFSR